MNRRNDHRNHRPKDSFNKNDRKKEIRYNVNWRNDNNRNDNNRNDNNRNDNNRNDYNRNDNNRNDNNRNDNSRCVYNRNDNNRNDYNHSNYRNNNNYHKENDRDNYNCRKGFRGWNRGDKKDYYNENNRRSNDYSNDRNNFSKKFDSFYNSRYDKMNRAGSVPAGGNYDWTNNDDDQSENSHRDSSNDRNNFRRKFGSSFQSRCGNKQRLGSVPPIAQNNCPVRQNKGDNQSEDRDNQNMSNITKKRKRDYSQRSAGNDKNADFRPQPTPNKRTRMNDEKQNADDEKQNHDNEVDSGTWDPWCDVKENFENSDKEINEPITEIGPEEDEEVQVEPEIDETNSNFDKTSFYKELTSQAMMKLTVYHCTACKTLSVKSEDAMKHMKTEYHKLALRNLSKKLTGIDILTSQDLTQACKMVNFDENLVGSSLKKRKDSLADSIKNL